MIEKQQSYGRLLEYIKANVKCLDIAEQAGCTVRCVSSNRCEYMLAEYDSIRINDVKNCYYRHSSTSGGSCIDLYMLLHDCDFKAAVSAIRKGFTATPRAGDVAEANIGATKEKKEFVLPPRNDNSRRVYAYLGKTRHICPEVISYFLRHRLLYEDALHHNCVFVGYDSNGVAAFAALRGSTDRSTFKGIVGGSDYDVGFCVSNSSDTLFVAEAVIDIMSVMSFFCLRDVSFVTSDYLALCGLSTQALFKRLEDGRIKHIFLCLDNDSKGRQRTEEIIKALSGFDITVDVLLPMAKDFNLDLKNAMAQSAPERD